ncbi:unnamed protein product [Cylindrotheca closterium]|uniref:Uncharacterized protein n=1 Tax=Cylindrotheca closterium TaxID=2856 RepID=A0AAD2JLI5_9STRA|nr:unnamed protein product [Cylindrotheca closterium]
MRSHHDRLYSVSYGLGQELKQTNVSEILDNLKAPEFPTEPLLPPISENESRLELSRKEAKQNLMWIDMKSITFSGSLSEAWVQLHALNLRFWKAASTLNEDSTPEYVVQLKQDLDRFSSIVKVAFASANEGRYTMSVVIQSYELLAAVVCFCFAHREMEQKHTFFKEYIPAFDPNDLDHLVLDDKGAIDAARKVRHFLETRANRARQPFRNHEDTWSLAKHFASEQSERAKMNRQLHKGFLTASRREIEERWRDISERQDILYKLDRDLSGAKRDLVTAQARLEKIQQNYNYQLDPSYNNAVGNVNNANARVSSLKREIESLEWKPSNLTYSLPEESDAESLLFFIIMDGHVSQLAEIAHRAECLLWH